MEEYINKFKKFIGLYDDTPEHVNHVSKKYNQLIPMADEISEKIKDVNNTPWYSTWGKTEWHDKGIIFKANKGKYLKLSVPVLRDDGYSCGSIEYTSDVIKPEYPKIPSPQFRKKIEERVNIEKSEQIESFVCYNERCDYGIFRLKSIYHDKK